MVPISACRSLERNKDGAAVSNRNMQPLSKPVVIEAVIRAMGRASAVTRARFRRRVNSLATIAVIAPFLGFFITLLGVIGAFPGFSGEKLAYLALVTSHLSYAIARSAAGLMVGLISYWFYRYLRHELGEFDLEMRSATLELANVLCLLPLRK